MSAQLINYQDQWHNTQINCFLLIAIPRSPESDTLQPLSTTVEFKTFHLLVVTRGDI